MKKECIIYTFGIANDWTFEDMMAGLGCQIYSYDHTVDYPERRGDNIMFHKTGLGKGNNLKLLEEIIAENGHQNTTIEYLKV